MNRQVLVIHYYGDKSIPDDVVGRIGQIICAHVDDKFRITKLNELDIVKLLVTEVIKPHEQHSADEAVPSELVKAVDFVVGVAGKPEKTHTKTGESKYIEALYKVFVTLFMSHDDKKRLYKNAAEIILRKSRVKSDGSHKVSVAYLRDRGFTEKIVEAIAHQYDYLSSY